MPKRPLGLGFINKFDDYLLRNKPDTWTTRIHLVVYYTVFAAIVLSLICFVIPDNPLRQSLVGYWIMAQSVLVIVAIIFWIVYLVRFNNFKSYGLTHGGDRVKTYFFFFIGMVLMCSTCFIPPVVESYKTMIRYSPSQIVEDMDKMNVLLARLMKDENPAEITVDTIYVIDPNSTYQPTISGSGGYQWNDSLGAYTKEPIHLSRQELKYTLTNEDSVLWLNNNKLIRYQVTTLQFVQNWDISEKASTKPLRSFDIYNQVYYNDNPVDLQKLQKEFFDVSEKYRDPYNEDDYWNYSTDPAAIAAAKYKTAQVSGGISNIVSRYYRWDTEEMIIAYHSIYYVAMFLGLCLFVFRHSTMRTFFLSILAGVLLAIITGIFAAFLHFNEKGIFITSLVYFALFFIFAVTTVQWKVRSVFTGMALNLAVVCTPFIPVICTVLYYEIIKRNYYDSYAYGYYGGDPYDYKTEQLHIYISEVFGFIILLVLIETVYKWMYRKWYAAPEE
jgi:hypothetical protein